MGIQELILVALIGMAMAQGPEKRRTGNICSIDMDCPDNAFCRLSSYCVCKDGFVYAAVNSTHKACLKEARLNEQCEKHIQCQSTMGSLAECEHGICKCVDTAHSEDDRCYVTAVVGDRCTVDENCYLGPSENGRLAYCIRGFCTCPLRSSPRDNGTRCVPDARLGEPCEDQLQCAGVGLECRGTCQCRPGFAAKNDSQTCHPYAKELGQACEYDIQCERFDGPVGEKPTGAALCLGGQCECSFSARAAGNPPLCFHRKRPGEECTRDEECVSEEDEPGYCLNGRCTCKTCVPDSRDFGGASAMSCPPLYVATMFAAAAILRH